MIRIELVAAVLLSIEKKYAKTAKLNGPPPMPRNDDIKPSTKPATVLMRDDSIFRVLILFRLSMYTKVPRVRMAKDTFWTIPKYASLLICCLIKSNRNLPPMPPAAAPTASQTVCLLPICIPVFLVDRNDATDMANTVQLEIKLIVETGNGEMASITGRMIIPPPTPQIAPIPVATKQMTTYII